MKKQMASMTVSVHEAAWFLKSEDCLIIVTYLVFVGQPLDSRNPSDPDISEILGKPFC